MFKEIQKYLGDFWTAYRSAFKDSLKADVLLLDKINGYLLGHTGKQLRPALTLLTSTAICGECPERVVKCAAAVELLHTATLLHDDVVDGSRLRRGNPTVNSMYGATSAVLIGDFWLSRAVSLILDNPDDRVLKEFARSLNALSEGEVLQLEKSMSPKIDEDAYFEIISRKTSSLFETAVLSAAYSVSASEEIVSAMYGYAMHLGRAFQIRDDILDYSPALNTGKPSGQDIMERKLTLPLIGALKAAPSKVSSAFLKKVKALPEGIAGEALSLVKEYDGLKYAAARLEEEVGLAVEHLSVLSVSKASKYLEQMAKSLSSC